MVEAHRSQYGWDFINVMPTICTGRATIITPNTKAAGFAHYSQGI